MKVVAWRMLTDKGENYRWHDGAPIPEAIALAASGRCMIQYAYGDPTPLEDLDSVMRRIAETHPAAAIVRALDNAAPGLRGNVDPIKATPEPPPMIEPPCEAEGIAVAIDVIRQTLDALAKQYAKAIPIKEGGHVLLDYLAKLHQRNIAADDRGTG